MLAIPTNSIWNVGKAIGATLAGWSGNHQIASNIRDPNKPWNYKPPSGGGASGGWSAPAAPPPSAPPPQSVQYIPYKPSARAIDVTGIFSRASQKAARDVDPYYTHLFQQAMQKTNLAKDLLRRTAADVIKGAENELADTLEAGGIERSRSTEDTARTVADTIRSEAGFQEESGEQFDASRQALESGLAESGLGESGLGRQQVSAATRSRNRQEAEAVRGFGMKRETAEILKNRKFQDLAFDEKIKGRDVNLKKESENFKLENLLKQKDLEHEAENADLRYKQLVARQTAEQNAARQEATSTITGIRDAGEREATMAAYGWLMR